METIVARVDRKKTSTMIPKKMATTDYKFMAGRTRNSRIHDMKTADDATEK